MQATHSRIHNSTHKKTHSMKKGVPQKANPSEKKKNSKMDEKDKKGKKRHGSEETVYARPADVFRDKILDE